ncbi:MAG TPA: 4'-phosphopantetheinyl transferase superfamily protein, partial [Caldithrix abyssi]|nr:4'-phosphopantetheinyl transferase superfamily protein [Caldithrix abyssi]
SPLAPVGVDIEHFRKETTTVKIAERFFSNKEVQAFLALNDEQREEGFFNAWTRKEAFIKAAGLGLSMPLHSFDVTLTPGQEARLLDVRHPGYQAGDWLLRALPVSPPYAGAFCIKHRAPRLRLWQTQ